MIHLKRLIDFVIKRYNNQVIKMNFYVKRTHDAGDQIDFRVKIYSVQKGEPSQ